MGGNYQKGLYNQLLDVMERLESMEAAHQNDHAEIKRLSNETAALKKKNAGLQAEIRTLKSLNETLSLENETLKKENRLLRDDNERMKRILGNDSSNSSKPPSSDGPGKAANTYNGRKHTGRKQGAQKGHRGSHPTKADVERKISEGLMERRVIDLGDPREAYVSRYRIDLEIRAVATEIRIHADGNGKYQIPDSLRCDVVYGDTIKAIASYLYSEGVVSIDRICDFVNSLSGDAIHVSAGSVYGFCRDFSGKCAQAHSAIEDKLLNAPGLCTDATTVTLEGKQSYIRNFSTEGYVLYESMCRKDIESLGKLRVLSEYAGILCHDHETALYRFGRGHAECNVHLARYLRKNTEETGNRWSQDMGGFLEGMNQARKELIDRGCAAFPAEKLKRYLARYDRIVEDGREQNRNTKGRYAKKEEKALLNRLEKYKDNHLLFLKDFRIPYSNNMSERDLRPCKNREKMAGGFRTEGGEQMYCDIMSFIGTMKRKKRNILQSIKALLNGTLALD